MTRWLNFPKLKGQLAHVIGAKAEDKARRYLQTQGLELVAKNYRCKAGEIDLIMLDGSCLVFVEVKYRSNDQHGSAIDYFTPHKRRKLLKAIAHYTQAKHIDQAATDLRIDVVAIDGNDLQWLPAV